jgi:predicted transcriptional regulator
MIQSGQSVRDQIFFYIKDNPGVCRTEVRDDLKLQNNVSGPAIKELVDKEMVVEGAEKVSRTTNKSGKSLYVAADWKEMLDAQNKLFE